MSESKHSPSSSRPTQNKTPSASGATDQPSEQECVTPVSPVERRLAVKWYEKRGWVRDFRRNGSRHSIKPKTWDDRMPWDV